MARPGQHNRPSRGVPRGRIRSTTETGPAGQSVTTTEHIDGRRAVTVAPARIDVVAKAEVVETRTVEMVAPPSVAARASVQSPEESP